MCTHKFTVTHTQTRTFKGGKGETEHDMTDRKQLLCYHTDKVKRIRSPAALFLNLIHIKITK